MKILHLLGNRKLPQNPDITASSGVVNAVLETARALVQLRHQVWVASVVGETWVNEWQGVKLLGLSPAAWAKVRFRGHTVDLRMDLPYLFLTRKEKFDLAIGNAYSYMRLVRAPVRFATFHSSLNFRGRGGKEDLSLKPKDFHRLAKDTDAQLAVSRFIAEQLREGLGSSGNVHLVYNGVDLDRFSLPHTGLKSLANRQSWGADEKAVVFLFAGAIVEEKGVIHLARVFAGLSCAYPNLHLVVAGGSLWNDSQEEYEVTVRSILEEARRKGKVYFLGKVERLEMPSVYAASDVTVMPSCCQEAFGLVALESLAAGKPVIASHVGGIPETVTPEVGILVPPGDEELLRAAMLKLAEDGDLRRKMAGAARKLAQKFSWSTTAETIDSVYAEVIKRRPGKQPEDE